MDGLAQDLTMMIARHYMLVMLERIAFRRNLRLIKSALLANWLEIIIAAGLLFYSVKLFLMYWFIQHVVSNALRTNYLRGLARVYQVSNEKKLIVIMRHLQITEEEAEEILEGEMSRFSTKQREFWKDYEEEAALYGL
jgi:hypothetical protein